MLEVDKIPCPMCLKFKPISDLRQARDILGSTHWVCSECFKEFEKYQRQHRSDKT